jgi:hypothetical protein
VSIVELVAVKELGPFDFRWPNGIESFERGWSFEARIADARFSGSHSIGAREVYGRERAHTVTWIGGEVEVEGVEADDYPSSQALISRLRRPGRRLPTRGIRSRRVTRALTSLSTAVRSRLPICVTVSVG